MERYRWRKWLYYNFAAGSFHTKNLCSRLYSIEIEFYFLKTQNRFLRHRFGDLGIMYTLCLQLVGKPVVDFLRLFVIIKLFTMSYGWDVMSGKSVEVGIFRREWVTLSANFRRKGASPANYCPCQNSRVTALSCGIKISGVYHLVLTQSTCVTDRWTELRLFRPR